MALPWSIPLECAPDFRPKKKPPQPSLLKHYCNLNLSEQPTEEVSVGMMCDVGIDNKEPQNIQRLIAAGMTIARIKIDGLEVDEWSQLIQSIRQAVYAYSAELRFVYPLAVAMDIKGPELMIGNLKGGLSTTAELVENQTVRLTKDYSWKDCGTPNCLYVNFENLDDLNPDDIIWIDSLNTDKIELKVTEIGDDIVDCICLAGGRVGSKAPVRIKNIPYDKKSVESLTFECHDVVTFDRLENKIAWAVAADIDALLIPRAECKDDVKFINVLLADRGKHLLVIACIETALAFDNFDEILTEADGVYIDRNILSLEVPVEKLFIAIKIMTAKCNAAGKPCIVKAVINEQIPVLCVTDTANLVLDGVDVISLQFQLEQDSPLKKLTVDSNNMAEICIAAACVVCKQAERIIYQPSIYGNIELMQTSTEDPTRAVCISTVELAMRSNAVAIITITNSGRTAKLLAHVRPPCPVIAVTRLCRAARQLRFYRAIRVLHYTELPNDKWAVEVESRIQAALDYCKLKRFIRAGDAFVTLTSTRRGKGYCDSIRLLYASARDSVYVDNEKDPYVPTQNC